MADDRRVELEITGRSEGLKKAAIDARVEVDRLGNELDELKASGNATNAEIAEAEARLEEASQKYREAATAAGNFAASQREAAEDIKRTAQQVQGFGGNIRSLDQALDVHIPKVAKFVGVLGLAGAAFSEAYQGTRQLIGGLKELGIDLDAVADDMFRLTEIADVWVNRLDAMTKSQREAALEAKELENAQKILLQRYGETASTLEEARQKLAQHTLAQHEATAAAKAQKEALFGNEEALRKSTAALLDAIAAEEKEGALTQEQVEIVKKALREKAEAYRAAGEEVDAALQAELDKWGVVLGELGKEEVAREGGAQKAEEAADRTAAAAAKKAEADEQAAARVSAALDAEVAKRQAASAAAVTAAEKKVDAALKELEATAGGSDPNAANRAAIEKELADLRANPQTAEQVKRQFELEDQLAKLRAESGQKQIAGATAVNEALGKIADANAELTEAQQNQAIALSDVLQREHDRTMDAIGDTRGSMEGLADVTEIAGVKLRGTFTDLGESTESAADLAKKAAGEFGDAFSETEDAADGAAESVGDVAKSMRDVADEADAVGESEGLQTPLGQAKELNAELQITLSLMHQIRDAANEIDI